MAARTWIVVGTALLALVGCGGSPGADGATDPVVLRAATLVAGQPLPTATGAPLLTVTGLTTADGTGAVSLHRSTLDRLTQVELRTYEPWLKRDLTFRGVWLTDALAVAGAGTPGSVRITALDDYTVDLTGAELAAGGILLATGDGTGAVLPVGDGGPTRIVFQDGARAGQNADQWIWSLRTIDVR